MNALSERLLVIDDADDQRVAEFRNIRERDLVGRLGCFVAEGSVVLNMLSRSGQFEAEKILVLEGRVPGISNILSRFDPEIPIMTCNRAVIDQIAGFPMHRGVLALGRVKRPNRLEALVDGLGESGLVLVCAGISNHDNLGGLFRNAAAFSADFVCLDEQCCDPLYRKSIRVSVGTALTMPFVRGGGIEDIVAQLASAGFDVLALSPSGSVDLADHRPGRRTALIVGTEGEGLAPDLLGRLESIRIAQSAGLDSLNVSVAAAIALHSIAAGMGRI